MDQYKKDYLKKEKKAGNKFAEDRLPLDEYGAWIAQRLKGRNFLQCLALTLNGDRILCSACGFPRAWLKITASDAEIEAAKLKPCGHCHDNPGKLGSPPSPRFRNGFPCQWARHACTAVLASLEELGSHYYVKHYSISG